MCKQTSQKVGGHVGRQVDAQVAGWVGRFHNIRGENG